MQCYQVQVSEFNNNFLLSKNSFEKELLRIIITKGLSMRPRIDTVVFFPPTLTCAERHRLHTYGEKDKISSRTRVKNEFRSIAITLKPKHVINIVEKYYYGV